MVAACVRSGRTFLAAFLVLTVAGFLPAAGEQPQRLLAGPAVRDPAYANHFGPVAETATFEFLADPTAWPHVPDIVEYGGKLYFSVSASTNTTNGGDIIEYDPVSGVYHKVYTVAEQGIDLMYVFNGKIYVPGPDATESWAFGNFYTYDGVSWQKHRTIPNAVHVHEMAYAHGTLYTTAQCDDATHDQVEVLYSSTDDGATWTKDVNIGKPASPGFFLSGGLTSFNDRVYVFGVDYSTARGYLFSSDGLTWTVRDNMPWVSWWVKKALAEFGGYLYIGTEKGLYQMDVAENVQKVDALGVKFIKDFTVLDGRLYVAAFDISAPPDVVGNPKQVYIYSSANGIDWSLEATKLLDSPPPPPQTVQASWVGLSIKGYGGSLYLGTAYLGKIYRANMAPAGPLHHITVAPSSPSVAVNGSQTFTATGYDEYGNPRAGDVFIWSVTDPAAGSINASTGVFTAGTAAGGYDNVIQAASGAVSGTTSVLVTPGALHHITVSPPDATLAAGSPQAYTAVGYDQYDNPRAGDVFAWSVADPSAGSIDPATGVFTGMTSGSYLNVIQAVSGAMTGTASVAVLPGPVHHVTVSPPNPSVAVNGGQTFTASGYDQCDNSCLGQTFTWSVNRAAAGTIDPASGSFVAGTVAGSFYAVQATAGGVSGISSVTVTPGPLHHITVSPGTASVPADDGLAFIATGYDQHGNVISGLTYSWSVSDPAAGSIDPSTGVFTAASEAGALGHVVHAESGAIEGTASVQVINDSVVNGTVTLQGGGRGSAGRLMNVEVRLFSTGTGVEDLVSGAGALGSFTAATQEHGSSTAVFQFTGVAAGDYDLTIASDHTLMNVLRGVTLGGGCNSVSFGVLLEGNCNDDGAIDALDFSILVSSYLKGIGQPGFDASADLDNNGVVNALDMTLMAANYLLSAPFPVS